MLIQKRTGRSGASALTGLPGVRGCQLPGPGFDPSDLLGGASVGRRTVAISGFEAGFNFQVRFERAEQPKAAQQQPEEHAENDDILPCAITFFFRRSDRMGHGLLQFWSNASALLRCNRARPTPTIRLKLVETAVRLCENCKASQTR